MVRWKDLQRTIKKDIKSFSRSEKIKVNVIFDKKMDFCHFKTPLVRTDEPFYRVGTNHEELGDLNINKKVPLSNEDTFLFLRGKNHDLNHLNLLYNFYNSSTDPLIQELAIEQLSNYSQRKFTDINYPNMMYEAYCDKMAWLQTIEEFKNIYDGNNYEQFLISVFNNHLFDDRDFSFIDVEKYNVEPITSSLQIAEYFDLYSPLNRDFSKDYNIYLITVARLDSIKQRCDEHVGGPELLESLKNIKDPCTFNRELLSLNLAIDSEPRLYDTIGLGCNLKSDFYSLFNCITPNTKQEIIDRANEICHLLRKDYQLPPIDLEHNLSKLNTSYNSSLPNPSILDKNNKSLEITNNFSSIRTNSEISPNTEEHLDDKKDPDPGGWLF